MWKYFVVFLAICGNVNAGPEAGHIYSESRKSVATFQWRSLESDVIASFGTAFFLTPSIIVTNVHVAANQASENGQGVPYLKLHNGDSVSLLLAEVYIVNPDADIVVLFLPKYVVDAHLASLGDESILDFSEYLDLPSILVSKSNPLVGDDVYVVGSPAGLEQSLSTGIVSSIREVAPFGECYQTTAQISPGSSGSPAFNSKGELVGVATFKQLGGEGLNFLVPAARIFDGQEIEQPLMSWAKDIVTESEIASATKLYSDLLDTLSNLALEEEFFANPDGEERLKDALSRIKDGSPDVYDPAADSPEATSWGYLIQVCQGLMEPGDVESVIKMLLSKAAYFDSVGSKDKSILRFAASFGQDGSRNAYLEQSPGDELLRWGRACDTAEYFLRVPNAYVQLGENKALVDAVEARVDLLENDLNQLMTENVHWRKNARFVGLRIVLDLLQGNHDSALNNVVIINNIDHKNFDRFFGMNAYRSLIDSSIQTSILLGNASRGDAEIFTSSVKSIGVKRDCHLGQELLEAIDK